MWSFVLGFVCLFVCFVCLFGFFFYSTIELVTFRLRGWCMLGMFLLPAFTHLGHEYQDLLRWTECVYRLDLGLYSRLKEILGTGVGTHVNSKGIIPSTRGSGVEEGGGRGRGGGSNPPRCIMLDSEPNTLPTELFLAYLILIIMSFCCCGRHMEVGITVLTLSMLQTSFDALF